MLAALATVQRGTMDLRRPGDREALTSWLDTLDTHLYRLHLITGCEDCLTALQMINQLRTEAATNSQVQDPQDPASLQELAGQLYRVLKRLHPDSGTGQRKSSDLQT